MRTLPALSAFILAISTHAASVRVLPVDSPDVETAQPEDGPDATRTFVYSLGTNFDFIEDVAVSKTYHDLKVWVPGVSGQAGWKRLGFEFNFDRFRTFSTPDSSQVTYRSTDGSLQVVDGDTSLLLQFITNKVQEKTTSRFDNVGFSLSPLWRVSSLSNKNFYFGIGPSVEWQRTILNRTIDRTFERSVSDSVPNDWPRPYATTFNLPREHDAIRQTSDNFYYGVGFRLMYRDNNGILNMRGILGMSETRTVSGGNSLLSIKYAPFVAVRAEVIEHRKSGIKIGSEFRMFMGIDKDDIFRNQPRFNLYIAKEFNLKKIGDLFSAQ